MIHPTAIVHPEAKVDPSVEIGPWCVVGKHVQLGPKNRLMSHVVLDGWTVIGEGNTFFPFSVIGAIPQDLKYKGEATRLVIGKNNTFRESITLNLGTVQGGGLTEIGNDNLLMAYIHVGHDCHIGNNVIMANSVGCAGHVTVEDFANIGGMVGLSQFVRVGAHTYVGGQSGLDKDVPPYCIAMGSRPTVIKGANIVGLKRRGLTVETIQKINESIKLWNRPDVNKDQCLLEIESQYGDLKEIKEFLGFIRESKTGVIR